MLWMLQMAEGFLDSARLAADRTGKNSEEAVFQNLGYSVELGLKASLREKDWTDERCRRELRHDLIKIMNAAENAGLLVEQPEDTRRLLAALTPYYAQHRIKDFVRQSPPALDLRHSMNLAAALMNEVRGAMRL